MVTEDKKVSAIISVQFERFKEGVEIDYPFSKLPISHDMMAPIMDTMLFQVYMLKVAESAKWN